MRNSHKRSIFLSLEGLAIGGIYVLSWWVVSTQIFSESRVSGISE